MSYYLLPSLKTLTSDPPKKLFNLQPIQIISFFNQSDSLHRTNELLITHQFQIDEYIIIMKQIKQNTYQTAQWQQALKSRYIRMSVLQLKKQKMSMVKDLEQINVLLDQMITQQVQQSAKFVQNIDTQIDKMKRMQKGLVKSLINFQYMLSGDYSVKADDEISRLNTQVKTMRQEVTKFNRMLSIPMQKDIQICEQLQKEVYLLQKELQQAKAKNKKKKQNIAELNSKNDKKLLGIKKITKQLSKLKEDEPEVPIDSHVLQQNYKNYEQLISKKDKLLSFIEKDEKRFINDFKMKTKKFKQMEETSYEIQHYLNQIEEKLEEKNEELKKIRERKRSLAKKQKIIESFSIRNKKSYTQSNSEIENLYKQRQKHHQNISLIKQRTRQRRSQPHLYIQTPSKQSHRQRDYRQHSDQLLPKLYKALGRQRLHIEQDCDINDLIY